MKFQKLDAFERHVKESSPGHLSPIYLILAPQESERKKILTSLRKLFQGDFKRFTSAAAAATHLQSHSLFSEKPSALLEGADSLTKDEEKALFAYLKAPNPSGHLLIGMSSAKKAGALYQKGKKEIIFLDLSAEKPWEEKDRRKRWIAQRAGSAKKRISVEAVEMLASFFPADRLLLDQEIEKLATYVGVREQIEAADVTLLCTPTEEESLFQMAQQLVWDRLKKMPQKCELSLLLPLIGQLRYHLEMGLKMTTYLERGVGSVEIGKKFPTLRPRKLEEYLAKSKAKKAVFFKEGLKALYDFELGAKTALAKPEILFTRFCARMGSS